VLRRTKKFGAHMYEETMKITSQEDFWAGLMFVGFGVLALIVSRDYPMGSAMRMGPGYFPAIIGGALIGLGGLIAALGFRNTGEGIGTFPWRAIVLLSVGFALFAWGMDTLGFIPSLAILIILSSLSSRQYRWVEIAIETFVLIVGCWAVFIYGLGLPFPLWWGE
jgi:Tripartite tricarboxylate transporter TctB family